jgi:predicted dehydrogenase
MAALSKMDDVQIAACADVDSDRAALAAARFAGAAAYADLGRMLDEHRLDAAYVCVPPHAHGRIELALIERGIPFFVEKPIGNDRDTPRHVLDALGKACLVTSVGYMMRYRETVRRLKECLADDEPVVARGAWIGGMPAAAWWRRKDQGGGQVNEQTTHLLDLARYLFGQVTSVFCAGRRGLVEGVEDYSVEDASICTLTFESGLVCEIASSCAAGKGEISLDVFTRRARARLQDWEMNLTLSVGNETHVYAGAEDVFFEEDRAFLDAVRSGDAGTVRSPYADAFSTQMVACAANESMERGVPVRP